MEAVPDKPDQVKMTPWQPQQGCLCHLSLVLPKSAIESVTPTGQKHPCCGKVLLVVEVKFKEGATLELRTIFDQLHSHASHPHRGSEEHTRPFDFGGHSGMAPDRSLIQTGDFRYLCGGRPCPPRNVCVSCNDREFCASPGTSCCGQGLCGPGSTCLTCGDQPPRCASRRSFCCGPYICSERSDCLSCDGQPQRCVPKGTTCCGSMMCGSGTGCYECDGHNHCGRAGSSCCGTNLCGPGLICMSCGGQLRCVRQGSTCVNGVIAEATLAPVVLQSNVYGLNAEPSPSLAYDDVRAAIYSFDYASQQWKPHPFPTANL